MMVTDAEPAVVITVSDLAHRFDGLAPVILRMDVDWPAIDGNHLDRVDDEVASTESMSRS